MNAVVIAVIVMLALSLARVHVVLSLTVGAFVGGLLAGMPLTDVADAAGKVSQPGIITVFQNGLSGGAKIALSYAMLGAFAMAITHSGLPQQLAGAVVRKLNRNGAESGTSMVKWLLLLVILVMGVLSQNVVPIHIAFIPMVMRYGQPEKSHSGRRGCGSGFGRHFGQRRPKYADWCGRRRFGRQRLCLPQ